MSMELLIADGVGVSVLSGEETKESADLDQMAKASTMILIADVVQVY